LVVGILILIVENFNLKDKWNYVSKTD
jgi:hypothetical protein